MAYAIVMSEYGGPEVLRRESITVGFPGKGELRLRQTCLGVNFHDIYVRTGLYKTLALPGIPGIEGVGIVEEVGDEIGRLGVTLNDMLGRLEASFSGLRRFTADASHELKTPLTVLRADIERAMSTAQGSEDQLIALEEALHETTRMADLVESLLTLARADEGRYDLHLEPVSLEALLRDARDVYQEVISVPGLSPHARFDLGVWRPLLREQ